MSGPAWEYFSCENSLTSGGPSIFDGPRGKSTKNDLTFGSPMIFGGP
jgi:hypothetical protein